MNLLSSLPSLIEGVRITVEQVQALAMRLAEDLEDAGRSQPAGLLRDAAQPSNDVRDQLLDLRVALVSTRSAWEEVCSPERITEASAALAEAKRMSIEL